MDLVEKGGISSMDAPFLVLSVPEDLTLLFLNLGDAVLEGLGKEGPHLFG